MYTTNVFQTIAFQFEKLVSTSIILREKKIRMKYNKPRSADVSVADIILYTFIYVYNETETKIICFRCDAVEYVFRSLRYTITAILINRLQNIQKRNIEFTCAVCNNYVLTHVLLKINTLRFYEKYNS